jgi:hypothetical protein
VQNTARAFNAGSDTTGTRLGEATAIPWVDIDFDQGTVRIARYFSNGHYLAPTKTGRERTYFRELTPRTSTQVTAGGFEKKERGDSD